MMTNEELFKWLETCPTQEWAAVEEVDGEVVVYFPVTDSEKEETMMKEVKITEFNKNEFNYLADMIHEKIVDMGYDNDGSFSFDLIVRFEEEND
jgi:hypothetical protein